MRISPILKTVLLVVFGAVTFASGFAELQLHVLPGKNIDRLRLDFNASRSKVRLVFMLSPT